MNNVSKRISAVCLPLLALSMFSCAKESASLKDCAISEDPKFGAANLAISIESFNNLGFTLGDSCSVSFSNGYSLKDVPYFNGYYVKNGSPVIVAYPSSSYISITLNNVGIWNTAALADTDTVNITLNEKGKYLATQEALSQTYSLTPSDYSSNEEFANFRALQGGKIKKDCLFRGASPFDNSRNRAPYVDALLSESKIKTIVDLADSESDIEGYLADEEFNSPYAKGLYENGQVVLLSMGSGYSTPAYQKKVAEGARFMIKKEAPYYIHCMEGKDRTGFVCTLLEALCGASYTQMRDDYMLTYKNYYKISPELTPEKYEAIVSLYFDSFMECLLKSEDTGSYKDASYVEAAEKYLEEGGLSKEEISSLKKAISE